MLIAQEKEKTNIAEYVLYMWQLEDIIRSKSFDLNQITESVISQFDVAEEVRYDMKLWYQELITQMMKEGIAEKGHLKKTLNYIEELNNLHNSLLTTIQSTEYQQKYLSTKSDIKTFMDKSGGEAHNEIHACFIALYGFLILKLKRAEISSETKQAINSFSEFLALLVNNYNKVKKGQLELPKEKSN